MTAQRLTERQLHSAAVAAGITPSFTPKPDRKKSTHEEHRMQVAVVSWWNSVAVSVYKSEPQCLFAIPNGGRVGGKLGSIFKREGVRAGVCDLFLMIPRYRGVSVFEEWHHGLFIEMKTEKGTVSDEQTGFLILAETQGYLAQVHRSEFTAIQAIKDYLA